MFWRSVVPAAILLAGCTEPPQPACTLRQPATEFQLPRAQFYFIPVTIGRTTVPFILDTGSAISILSTEAGEAMGFKPTTEWQFVGNGAGGQVLGYPTRVSVLRLGNGTLFGALFSVQPLFNLPLSRWPVFGLIATADLMANESSYIELEVTLDNRTFDAVLDTGATTSLLGATAAHRLHLDFSHDRAITGIGVGGLTYTGHDHRFDNVVVGGTSVGPMTFGVSTRDLAGTDLLLGQDFLRDHRVFVSFRQHRLWFTPASTPHQDAVSARR